MTTKPDEMPGLLERSSLFREFLAERAEILRNKWLESEKAGRDIGFEQALASWLPQAGIPVSAPVATAVAAALVNGAGNVSLRIYGINATADGLVNYGSREGAAGVAPLLTVASSAGPSLSATQSFWVAVTAPERPQMTLQTPSAGQFRLTISGSAGPDYIVQGATNLSDPVWQTLLVTNAPSLPLQWTDTSGSRPQFYYRVLLGP
jgi:hypothetical protein